ncbi:MAG: hypothetical protein FWE19_00645 [Oscillospiraceae bacterium]|nr:hypothetical protein [Oscillospiraceae bacterium]
MKNDWKSKLTSRKFWLAIVGFVSPLIIARGGSAELAYEITALIMSGAAVIAYIIGQGLVDAKCAEYDLLEGVELEVVEDDGE